MYTRILTIVVVTLLTEPTASPANQFHSGGIRNQVLQFIVAIFHQSSLRMAENCCNYNIRVGESFCMTFCHEQHASQQMSIP